MVVSGRQFSSRLQVPATALRAARAADPTAKLYVNDFFFFTYTQLCANRNHQINDFNIEGSGAKSTAMMNFVRTLKSQGVPIDGIGIQSHLIVGQVPSTFQSNLQAFAILE